MPGVRSALVVMDFQNGVIARQPGGPEALERVSVAIAHARTTNVPVIYVRVAFRTGYPEVSPDNRMFAGLVTDGYLDDTAELTQIHAAVAPAPGEVIVTKRRVGAFMGSDLEVVLRSQQISTLVLAGISTSGVVLSTVRDAADRDFRLVVLSDACTDRNSDVHKLLLEKVIPMQASVIPVDQWIGSAGPS